MVLFGGRGHIRGKELRINKMLVFSRNEFNSPDHAGNILLCDDLSDTGVTLNKSIDWLKKYFVHKIE